MSGRASQTLDASIGGAPRDIRELNREGRVLGISRLGDIEQIHIRPNPDIRAERRRDRRFGGGEMYRSAFSFADPEVFIMQVGPLLIPSNPAATRSNTSSEL